jgi:hypothetical protein
MGQSRGLIISLVKGATKKDKLQLSVSKCPVRLYEQAFRVG